MRKVWVEYDRYTNLPIGPGRRLRRALAGRVCPASAGCRRRGFAGQDRTIPPRSAAGEHRPRRDRPSPGGSAAEAAGFGRHGHSRNGPGSPRPLGPAERCGAGCASVFDAGGRAGAGHGGPQGRARAGGQGGRERRVECERRQTVKGGIGRPGGAFVRPGWRISPGGRSQRFGRRPGDDAPAGKRGRGSSGRRLDCRPAAC